MNIGKWCRLPLMGMAALVILSGCANQQKVESPELLSAEAREEAIDLGSLSSLTPAEKKAYASTAKLDRNLSPVMERQVRYHFLKYSRERRGTMENFLRNSIPYLNYTKSVFRSRGLPEDLAYLAYLESGYNPVAVSRSNAVGMWQFISSTGKAYGLRQDWWMDERRDPYRSTEAAASYLARLYDIFHDWQLAVASYNGGEGKIGRAKEAAGADKLHEIIQKNDRLDYNLQLREETMLYVPRFLAISKIMRNADTLGLQPAAPDADHPVLVPVAKLTAKPATDLVELSRRLNMDWKEFLAYNPHVLRSISPAGRSCSIYVPKNKESQARALLAGRLSGAGWRYYTVAKGDSLARVSSRTGIPASVIKQLNPGKLKRGQRLRLPSGGKNLPAVQPSAPVRDTAIASASSRRSPAKSDYVKSALAELRGKSALPATYKVQSGDTLSAIARKYDMELGDLYAANGGADKLGTLRVGQVIRLSAPAAAKAVPAKRVVSRMASHTVKSGETAYAISRKYGITFQELCEANGGADRLDSLSPGQKLNIPSGKGTAVAAAPDRAQSGKKAPAKAARKSTVAENYCVQNGETLWSISRKFNMKPMELLALNGMDQSTRVKVGDTVKVIRHP
ncbi:LysM peptidoglycan-binding domain-containing protein [Mailhella massiliensis]|uniref:LysM peptidoglycan-binding domain-containing protein n=1 Tax=Mailhella massiliensis TaxID=1903261 RepID=A0A921AUN1_9BACT|nr:LysM peptidoglycan-binding domain-containing protein [Mailhella massiliensis]HJD96164.1 LysM peptidoglycan-binding domain-containing protein [Mailhella massiliensis]